VREDAVASLAIAGTAATRAQPQAQTKPAPQTQAKTSPQTQSQTQSNAAAPYAVQIGAFRDKSSAAAAAKKLVQLGFDARVANVKGSALVRVRVGKFATSRAAADELRRLRSAGYDAVVVDDVKAEQE
jgi:DedD protein